MDERHWWIATRVQEAFLFGGDSSPTAIESFMLTNHVLHSVNFFFAKNGSTRLFFYFEKNDSSDDNSNLALGNLRCSCSLDELGIADFAKVSSVYFFRYSVDHEVHLSRMDSEIFSGELKGNIITGFSTLVSNVFLPLIKATEDYGSATVEQKDQLFSSMDKFSQALSEARLAVESSYIQVLSRPKNLSVSDVKLQRNVDPHQMADYEALVSEWIRTIDDIILSHEEGAIDLSAVPSTEYDRWRRRHRLLTSITEQLRGKECKAVIGTLITSKSRLLKKWKVIDACLTDAVNEAKDRVKYLEALRRNFHEIEKAETPNHVADQALPQMMVNIKQMGSVSRANARQGFLGILLTKLSNLLISHCRQYLESAFEFKSDIRDVLLSEVATAKEFDTTHKGLLQTRVTECKRLATIYKNEVRNMRESLVSGGHSSRNTSSATASSLNQQPLGRYKLLKAQRRTSIPSSPTKTPGAALASVADSDVEIWGVNIHDESTIFGRLENFIARIQKFQELLSTLALFYRAVETTKGLKRPNLAAIVANEEKPRKKRKKHKQTSNEPSENITPVVPEIEIVPSGKLLPLEAIAEADDELQLDASLSLKNEEIKITENVVVEDLNPTPVEVSEIEKSDSPVVTDVEDKKSAQAQAKRATDQLEDDSELGLSKEDVSLLKRYFNDLTISDTNSHCYTVSSFIHKELGDLIEWLSDNITVSVIFTVDSETTANFDHSFDTFVERTARIDRILEAYLNGMFCRKLLVMEALNIVTSFEPLQSRGAIRPVVAEKMVDAFLWYQADLAVLQVVYEEEKDNPPMIRNAPKVAGAIHWCRNLFRRVDDPMAVFRDTKSITRLKDFGRVAKLYNHIATTLLTFEMLYLRHWQSQISEAKVSLRGKLLTKDAMGQIIVHADDSLLELMEETKWLQKMGVTMPTGSEVLLRLEPRFRSYLSTLGDRLQEFRKIRARIPDQFLVYFQPHIDKINRTLQPGLASLSWDSLNIDAFLHAIDMALMKLRFLVDEVTDILDHSVEKSLYSVAELLLFDAEKLITTKWNIEELDVFLQNEIEINKAVIVSAAKLIEEALLNIVSLLTSKKIREMTFTSLRSTNEARTLWHSETSKISSPVSAQSLCQNDTTVSTLMRNFCDRLLGAVMHCVIRSVRLLAAAFSLLDHSDMPSKTDADSVTPDGISPVLPDDNDALAFQRFSRPSTALSLFSEISWSCDVTMPSPLQFNCELQFALPTIVVVPELWHIQAAIDSALNKILFVPKAVQWKSVDCQTGDELYEFIKNDRHMSELATKLKNLISDIEPQVRRQISHFRGFDFLWHDDLKSGYKEFLSFGHGLPSIHKEVERILSVEKKISSVPDYLLIGCINLHTVPVRNALLGMASNWKSQYGAILREEAKKMLDAAVEYRTSMHNRLEVEVKTLDHLNNVLHLIEELDDMRNKIDGIYLPIERAYRKLRMFELRLPRAESDAVSSLRSEWSELLALSDQVKQDLMFGRRYLFEQELDKQIKKFVVEVIQFRNAFDAQGPAVPGITPNEAVSRLYEFEQQFQQYVTKRKTLDSVARLFSIPCKSFIELDHTGEELNLLKQLYGLFQQFLRFDAQFRETLWANVDLVSSERQMQRFADDTQNLPDKLQEWDSYQDLSQRISHYLEILSIMKKLSSEWTGPKVTLSTLEIRSYKEIKSRHWLMIMQATGTMFPLEYTLFKMDHIMDIGLDVHSAEIAEICEAAHIEMELEIRIKTIADQWSEHVLQFRHYKQLGPIYLDKTYTERLLEQLEDSEGALAVMMTNRHVGPLAEEVASWAHKLREVGDVLETWLEVQDLWQYLEAVFSVQAANKDLLQESKIFRNIDKAWVRMMRKAHETQNVLQCCFGGDVSRGVVLRHIREELEVCFKSLSQYLDGKRSTFPRFYFVSDTILLALLSQPATLDSVKPHMRSLFDGVVDFVTEETMVEGDADESVSDSSSLYDRGRRRIASPERTTRIDKRLNIDHSVSFETPSPALNSDFESKSSLSPDMRASVSHSGPFLPSELRDIESSSTILVATAAVSPEGEKLQLKTEVPLQDAVEDWLQRLLSSVSFSLREQISEVLNSLGSIPLEDLPARFVCQACRLGLSYTWTVECEGAIGELKYERKALQQFAKKFSSNFNKLQSALTKRSTDLPEYRIRTEPLLMETLMLRDVTDNLVAKKIKDSGDFEWFRVIRPALRPNADGSAMTPYIRMMVADIDYGFEYQGCQTSLVLTPQTERCCTALAHAISHFRGLAFNGQHGVGKTNIVQSIARMCGRFLSIFLCSERLEPDVIGRLVQGVSQSGVWGLFDEARDLPRLGLVVLAQYVGAALNVQRNRTESTIISDGTEMLVSTDAAFFTTCSVGPTEPATLPTPIRSLFRCVSIIKPDTVQVIKAKCAANMIRSPNVLANRLAAVVDIASSLIPRFDECQFYLRIIITVLQKARSHRRILREMKLLVEKKDDSTSRSDSRESFRPPVHTPQSASGTRTLAAPLLGVGQKRSNTPAISQSAKMDHALVAHTLIDTVLPKLTTTEQQSFTSIVKDIFGVLPDIPDVIRRPFTSVGSSRLSVDRLVETRAKELGLAAHSNWVKKAVQLFSISHSQNGVILCGPSGSGKSTCLKVLVEALNIQPRALRKNTPVTPGVNPSPDETGHRLTKIYPLVSEDFGKTFGSLSPSGEWHDGSFITMLRKANRNQSNTWFCLDGPPVKTWVDLFTSGLDEQRALQLYNGDRLVLSPSVHLVFEAESLHYASPALVARTGVVFMGTESLDPLSRVNAWLTSRPKRQRDVLTRSMTKTLEPVIEFMKADRKKPLQNEMGLLSTLLCWLEAMLDDNVEISNDLHIERMLVFCLLWTFGANLDADRRQLFSNKLRDLTAALPDDDRDVNVFDYYVDESGEWDPWHSRLPEAVYPDNMNMLGDVYVDTTISLRCRALMELSCASKKNILVVGPSGVGKTALLNDFLDARDTQTTVVKRLTFSAGTISDQLYNFIQSSIVHRQGLVYGANDHKHLHIMVDDLNLPKSDCNGIQRVNELIRQVADDCSISSLEPPFVRKTLQDVLILASLSENNFASDETRRVISRLLHHFAVINLNNFDDAHLRSIVNGILEIKMSANGQPGLEQELHNAIVSASCHVLSAVRGNLLHSYLPGRSQYYFSIRELNICFQGIQRLVEEDRSDPRVVISLWKHELCRVFADRIARTSDINWWSHTIDSATQQFFGDVLKDCDDKLTDLFVTFTAETRSYQRGSASAALHKPLRILVQPVERLGNLHDILMEHVSRHNEEFGSKRLDLVLSEHVICHVVRLHRILTSPHSANLLLIGSVGSNLHSMVELALQVAEIPIYSIDCSRPDSFFDGLRSAVRLSGAEGRVLSLIFKAGDLKRTEYLDAINTLLVSGECLHLFSNDELDGLLQAITPIMKRSKSGVSDPERFLIASMKRNLRIVICLPPESELFIEANRRTPGFLSGCQIIWYRHWLEDALLGEAEYFLKKENMFPDNLDQSNSVANSLANIHANMLVQFNQMQYAGDSSPELTLTAAMPVKKAKTNMRLQTVKVPNLPYSKTILMEHIGKAHYRTDVPDRSKMFFGPAAYRRFLNCFATLYRRKLSERSNHVVKIKSAVEALKRGREDCEIAQKEYEEIEKQFTECCVLATSKLHSLKNAVMLLEKWRARFGKNETLLTFLELVEEQGEPDEEDDLLLTEEHDDYDAAFDRLREENLRLRQDKAKEEMEQAQALIDSCQADLVNAKENIVELQNAVDRNCIDRLKGFQNPPLLVGRVLEMVMLLIGKSKLPQAHMTGQAATAKVSRSPKAGDHAHLRSREATDRSMPSSAARSIKGPGTGDSTRFDRVKWKAIQQVMSDSVKFCELIKSVSWENGLDSELSSALEAYLEKNSQGKLGVTDEDDDGKRTGLGITLEAVRHSSGDASTLVEYVIALIEYTHMSEPLRIATEKLSQLNHEIEESKRQQREKEAEPLNMDMPVVQEEREAEEAALRRDDLQEENYTEEQLPELEARVETLKAEFDEAAVEKHKLKHKLDSMRDRLKATVSVVEDLSAQEQKWLDIVGAEERDELLILNALVVSAFITYCPPVVHHVRSQLIKRFIEICELHKVPLPPKIIFRNLSLADYLYTPLFIRRLELQGLPCSEQMLASAAFVIEDRLTAGWPLICDSTDWAIDWVKNYYAAEELVVISYVDLKSQLETSLAEGTHMLITHCDMNALIHDDRFRDVVTLHKKFMNPPAGGTFKLMVADQEVECKVTFRLLFHTTAEPCTLEPVLLDRLVPVNFTASRSCFEEELLDVFMRHEKSRLVDERIEFMRSELDIHSDLLQLENQMVSTLAECNSEVDGSSVSLLQNGAAVRKLMALTKHYEETVDSRKFLELAASNMNQARESYRPIAQRAAICFDTARSMVEVNRVYMISLSCFKRAFEASIDHSERLSVKGIMDRMTQQVFSFLSRGYSELDRHLYALLLAVEVEDASGRVGVGEREYMVSPQFAATVMHALGKESKDARFLNAKKPYDWMTDDQFNNVQLLAIHFPWAQEIFDRMPKEGRELPWRSLCEGHTPEGQVLPDKLDEQMTPIQKLCLLRALRNDRLIQASNVFISTALGKRFALSPLTDINTLMGQTGPGVPFVLLYRNDPLNCITVFREMAALRDIPTVEEFDCSSKQSVTTIIRERIASLSSQNSWLLLHSVCSNDQLASALYPCLTRSIENPSPNFRLWIAVNVDSTLPDSLLLPSCKIFCDSPTSMKENMRRMFSYVPIDALQKCRRPDFPVLLHHICLIHSAIRHRARFTRAGWSRPYDFYHNSISACQDVFETAVQEFTDTSLLPRDSCTSSLSLASEIQVAPSALGAPMGTAVPPKIISWGLLRYLMSEITCSMLSMNGKDRSVLTSLVDYWITPGSCRKDFETSRARYRTPAIFFTPQPKFSALQQSLDNISPYILETPEACQIHSSTETPDMDGDYFQETAVGDEQYIFTNLNLIWDSMAPSASLSHVLHPTPFTPWLGPPLVNVSSHSGAAHIIDRGVFASASYAALKQRKEIDLWDICNQLTNKLPRTYSKDFISEKLKKVGGVQTMFNQLIAYEMESLYSLVSSIKNDLEKIKSICESLTSMGDRLPADLIPIADSLYYQRIPEAWRRRAGASIPHHNISTVLWFQDLSNRAQHLERIVIAGREKHPAYWLNAFSRPQALLALLMLDTMRTHSTDRNALSEPLVFQTEITNRDKEHLREPAQDGLFIYGLFLWGALWERSTNELVDTPVKRGCTELPVLLLTCWPASEKPLLQDSAKASEIYSCPVYHTRLNNASSLFEIDLRKENCPAAKWAIRGLTATLRPY